MSVEAKVSKELVTQVQQAAQQMSLLDDVHNRFSAPVLKLLMKNSNFNLQKDWFAPDNKARICRIGKSGHRLVLMTAPGPDLAWNGAKQVRGVHQIVAVFDATNSNATPVCSRMKSTVMNLPDKSIAEGVFKLLQEGVCSWRPVPQLEEAQPVSSAAAGTGSVRVAFQTFAGHQPGATTKQGKWQNNPDFGLFCLPTK